MGQLFSMEHIGLTKTAAIKKVCKDFSNQEILTQTKAYDENSMASSCMMSCFDNMAARKVFFENWVKYALSHPDEKCIFIDGRLVD